MSEEERAAFKQALKNTYRQSLRQDVDEAIRQCLALGNQASEMQIVRALRIHVLHEIENIRQNLPPARQEDINIRIAAYCEIMDEFIRSASN
jgi:hypothetical protein